MDDLFLKEDPFKLFSYRYLKTLSISKQSEYDTQYCLQNGGQCGSECV